MKLRSWPRTGMILSLLLSGCSSLASGLGLKSLANSINTTPNPLTRSASPTPPPIEVSNAALIRQTGKLRVGIRFDAPPLSSVNKNGGLEGMDVDLAREFARRWLGSPDQVEFVQITTLSAMRRMRNREFNIAMGGLAINLASMREAEFTYPYVTDGDAILVRNGAYADFASLAGKDVIYIDAQSLPAINEAQRTAGITVTSKSELSYDNALTALANSQTEAIAGRYRRLQRIAQKDPAYTVLALLSREPMGIMLPPNDSAWADLVNSTFSAMVTEGFVNQVYQKWFGTPPPEPIQVLPGPVPMQFKDLPDTVKVRDTMITVRTNGVLRVGFVPRSDALQVLCGIDAQSQASGLEVDLAKALATRIASDASVQFLALTAEQVGPALSNGQIDLAIGGIQRTQANERAFDFSAPTYLPGAAVSSSATLNTALTAPTGIALPMNDSLLKTLVNKAIYDMRADGTYEAIRAQWLGAN